MARPDSQQLFRAEFGQRLDPMDKLTERIEMALGAMAAGGPRNLRAYLEQPGLTSRKLLAQKSTIYWIYFSLQTLIIRPDCFFEPAAILGQCQRCKMDGRDCPQHRGPKKADS